MKCSVKFCTAVSGSYCMLANKHECICDYVYMFLHIYGCMCVHACIPNVYLYAYVCMCVSVCMYVCMYVCRYQRECQKCMYVREGLVSMILYVDAHLTRACKNRCGSPSRAVWQFQSVPVSLQANSVPLFSRSNGQ